MNALIYFIIIILAIVFAFKIHYILGIIFIASIAFYIYHNYYSSFLAARANAEYSNGNCELALEYYKQAVKKGKPSYSTFSGYSLMLLRSGEPEKALDEINKVLSSLNLPLNIKQQSKQIRALINYKLGNFKDSYEEALELYEDGYTISAMRGLLGMIMLTAEDNQEKVLAFCEEAYDYDSDNRDIVDNYLLALINMNKLEEAKEVSKKLIDMAPNFAESYYHSAILHKALGENQKAKELLEKISECKMSYMTTVSEKEIEDLKTSL